MSKSRMALLATGQRPDRVPLVLALSNYAPRISGISSKDFFLNPQTAFDVNLWTKKMFPDDSGLSYSVPQGLTWDFGGEVHFGDGWLDWPIIQRFPANTPSELMALKIPDPRTAPAVSREFEFAKIRRANGFKGGSLTLSSPFRQAVQLVDAQNLLRWTARNPELVHHVCRLTLEYSIKIAEMYAQEFGTNGWSIFVTYPMESHGLISPKIFKEFSAPYALELHERLQKLGIGIFTEHLCGNHRHNFWFWRDQLRLPPHTLISIGTDVPIQEVSSFFGENFIIGGNVDTISLIEKSPKEIYEDTRQLLDTIKSREGGFVLMAACAITTAVPPVNLTAMIQAAEDFGYY